MKSRRPIYIIIAIILIIGLWAAFRPELLFVKKPVDEPLPGATSQVFTLPQIQRTAV